LKDYVDEARGLIGTRSLTLQMFIRILRRIHNRI